MLSTSWEISHYRTKWILALQIRKLTTSFPTSVSINRVSFSIDYEIATDFEKRPKAYDWLEDKTKIFIDKEVDDYFRNTKDFFQI